MSPNFQVPTLRIVKQAHRKVGNTSGEVDGAGNSGGHRKAQARRKQQDQKLHKNNFVKTKKT